MIRALFLALVLAGSLAQPARSGDADACHDPTHPDHATRACRVVRLRARPFVVVAAVDSGINPYHLDFRLPPDDDRHDVHPSEYLEGFPADAEALELTFEVSTPAQGHNAVDRAAWNAVRPERPYWVPGTNVIGAVGGRTGGDFFDGEGHGTGVASTVGGLRYGRGTPNVVVVAVRDFSDGFRWAAAQPWIDLITISWSELVPLLDESAEAAHEAAASGKVTCVASGNLSAPIVAFEAQGPSAPVHVGAVDPVTRTMKSYSGWPNDVLGITDVTAARHDSISGTQTFGGTSAAAPHVCALHALALSEARQRVGDFREGPHQGGLATGPSAPGAFADGVLTRLELEDAVESTAVPLGSTPGAWAKEGYGLVEPATIANAGKVLHGAMQRPQRTAEDAWQLAVDAARDAVWDHVPPCPTC